MPSEAAGLVDIGVNFHSRQLEGLESDLLGRAEAAGVAFVLATGTSLDGSRRALDLARRHPARVRATAGLHPHAASAFDAAVLDGLRTLWREDAVVAVGECGLDYDRMLSPKEPQRRAFEAQLQAAVELRRPLFLHCHAAFDDFADMTRTAAAAGARGVVHCFTGGAAEVERHLADGFDIGITGWVTDPARCGALREALPIVPLDRLHLETDAPYLRPRNAGKTRPYNEPALLPFVAKAVAEARGVELAEVVRATSANSCRLFRLPA